MSGEVRQSQGWLAVAGLQEPDGLHVSTLLVMFVEQLAAAARQAIAMPELPSGHGSRWTSHLAAGTQWPGAAGST